MRATLCAMSARLIVGHLDRPETEGLISVVEPRGKPATFALAEPESLGALVTALATGLDGARQEPVRWGKLVLETVANEVIGSPRTEPCDAIVDGLRVAHRRLGSEGLELVPGSSSGVGFCAASIVPGAAQLVVVPPAQIFVVHQGVALSIPDDSEVGRGIWVRDDLRAEMFAGIGGSRDPDIRVYEAAVAPGDTILLISSGMARMLTEDDVRLALTYEDAATGAERLKQLALQRGVDAGVAQIIEIAASLEEGGPAAPTAGLVPVLGSRLPRPALRLDIPPVGSIFSTARDRLLEALDRSYGTGHHSSAPLLEDAGLPSWPVRPRLGEWRQRWTESLSQGMPYAAPSQPAMAKTLEPQPPAQQQHGPTMSLPLRFPKLRGSFAMQAAPASFNSAARAAERQARQALASLAGAGGVVRSSGLAALGSLLGRLAGIDLSKRRKLLLPALGALFAVLVLFASVRTIQSQQSRQLQQRFDSLVTAASQLETQARAGADRNETQSLVRRSQALLDQATSLKGDQPQIAAVRRQLQADLDRIDNIVALPEPTVVSGFSGLNKVAAASLVADPTALYVLDSAGQRVLQIGRQQPSATAVATKGDRQGSNQLGDLKLITPSDRGLLALDGNRNLWSYSVSKKSIQQVGLKSSGEWKDATAIAAYGPNVYVLDAGGGNIFRYASRDGLFTDAPTRFFQSDDPGMLGQAISMSIDGSIWLLTADGQILKLEDGGRQPLAITDLRQPLGKTGQIWADPDSTSLDVLDSTNNRVVQLTKSGQYTRQMTLNLPGPATSFWPDPAGHQLYVLTANGLYQYPLPA